MQKQRSQQSSQGQQTQNAPKHDKALLTAVRIGQTFLNKYIASNKEDNDYKSINQRWTKITAKAAIIYTLITIFIMCVSVAQVIIARQQMTVSKDTEMRQLSSYFGIEKLEVFCCKVPVFEGPPKEDPQVIKITIKNGGLTPGSDVRVRVGEIEMPFNDAFVPESMLHDEASHGPPVVYPFIEASLYTNLSKG